MKKRRIVFRVFPFNRLTFPILLNSWEQEGLDSNFEIIITEKPVKLFDGDVIIYSFMTPHLPIISDEIKSISEKNIIIAAGGPHISGNSELAEQIGINVLFKGYGEETFKEFGYDLLSGNITSEGKIYEQKDNINIDKYQPFSKYFRFVPPLEIFRGCLWKCKYCQTGTFGHSFRSIESIENFLKRLHHENFNRVTFISPSAFEYGAKSPGKIDIKRLSSLFDMVSGFNFKFFEYGIFPSEIRPGTFDPELSRLLISHVKNNSITLGAQSGSDLRLKELNRGHTTEDVEQDIETANSTGFKVNLDFILGYPDETDEERNITFKFIERISKKSKVKIHLHHFFPLSGSNYQFRLPSFLEKKDKIHLRKMKESGISTDWWEKHERTVKDYFSWLKKNFPDFFDKYL